MLRFLWTMLSLCFTIAFYTKNQRVEIVVKKAKKVTTKINYTRCMINSGNLVSVHFKKKDYVVKIPKKVCYGLNDKKELDLWYSFALDELFYDRNSTWYESALYMCIISLIGSLLPWKLISKMIHVQY